MNFKFIKPDYTLKNNLMAFGYECDSGWNKLIEDCFKDIDQYIKTYRKELYDTFEILQVKEKYGELRIYTSDETPTISTIIDYYMYKSRVTCEVCGKEGQTCHRGSWYKTLCEEHAKELEYESQQS